MLTTQSSQDSNATDTDQTPQTPQTPQQTESKEEGTDRNLLHKSDDEQLDIQNEIYQQQKNWYLPSPPLGIKYWDHVWLLTENLNVPYYVHISYPIYVIGTLIFSVCHKEGGHWFAMYLILTLLQLVAILLQVSFTLYLAQKFEAKFHRIILWPYGSIGYGCDYKQWSHFLLVEYSAPFMHGVVYAVVYGIAAVLKVASWNYVTPMEENIGINVLNGIWIQNAIIASLHVCIPVYSMKTARLMVNYLYRTRSHRKVAKLILLPTAFMAIVLMFLGVVDARPLPFYLSLWTFYQAYLIWNANRIKMPAKLPLFQLLDQTLRSKKRRTIQKSVNVGQQNRKEILHDVEVYEHEKVIRKKMSTLDENEEYEPNAPNTKQGAHEDVKEEEEENTDHDKKAANNHAEEIELATHSKQENDDKENAVISNDDALSEQKKQANNEKEEDMLNIDDGNGTQSQQQDLEENAKAEEANGTDPKEKEEDMLNLNDAQQTNEKDDVKPEAAAPEYVIADSAVQTEERDASNENDAELAAPEMEHLSPQISGDSAELVNAESTGGDSSFEMVDGNDPKESAMPAASATVDDDFVDVVND